MRGVTDTIHKTPCRQIDINNYYFPPGFLFSCIFVAALFLMFCSRLSALIKEAFTLLAPPPLPDDELLLDELAAGFVVLLLLPVVVVLMVVCLLKDVMTVALLPTSELGESERLFKKVIGLLDFGRLAALFLFTIERLQSEHRKTERGSLTSASLMHGWWHSWW